MEKKKCPKCNIEKSANEFWKRRRNGVEGLQSRCKQCEDRRKYEVQCDKCPNKYSLNHRHWRHKEKIFKCPECCSKETVERNKARANESIRSTKGYEYVKEHGTEKYAFKHRKRLEQHLGRALTREEVVHHLDGDKLNNSIENLWLCNAKTHNVAHHSLETIAISMYRSGEVIFNRETGKYERVKRNGTGNSEV